MKKKIILLIIVLIVICLGVVIFLKVNKVNKETKERIAFIKEKYNTFSNSVKEYNDIRSEYISLTDDFYLDEYPEKREKFEELFAKYHVVVNEIDDVVAEISPKCIRLYKDSDANKICSSYGIAYEKLINLYIGDTETYNKCVKEYNEYKEKEYEGTVSIHNEYIDYNEDGKYEGRNIDERSN